MATPIGEVTALISADARRFRKELDRSSQGLQKFGARMRSLAVPVAAATAATVGFALAFNKLISRGGQVINVQRLSHPTPTESVGD